MKYLITLLLGCLLSANAFAGSASSGKLSLIHFFDSGVVFVHTSGLVSGTPTCASSHPGRFALNATTPGGKIMAAAILAAYSTGKNVAIIGSGRCDVSADTETMELVITSE